MSAEAVNQGARFAAAVDTISQAQQELDAISARLLVLMEGLSDMRPAQLALDEACGCLSRGRHDLQRAKTRLTEATVGQAG